MQALWLVSFAVVACARSDGESSKTEPAEPARPEVAEVAEVAAAEEPPSCKTDLDCGYCPAAPCRCVAASSDRDCPDPETDCERGPCGNHSASCWNGTCRLRRAAATPCEQDDQCEIRADTDHCDLYPALVAAPPVERHQARGCGVLPSFAQFRALCDPTAKRCVLARATE